MDNVTIKSRSLIQVLSIVIVFIAVEFSTYLVFMQVPNDRILGPVQRIFYFHVASATACYVAFIIVFIASLAFLLKKNWRMDVISEAAGEVGFVFSTIVLASGMIWGHAAWNTWFRWEPRLVTFLLLWLIFLAFNILRIFGDQKKIAAHSAVLGILGTLTVPLVVLSIKLLPQTAQLHPQLIAKDGLDPSMKKVLFLSIGSIILLQLLLIWIRTQIGFLVYKKGEL